MSAFSPSFPCAVLQGAFYTPRIYDSQARKLVDRIAMEFRGKSVTVGLAHIDGNEASRKGVPTGDAGILLNKHMMQYAFELKGIPCEAVDVNDRALLAGKRSPEFIVIGNRLEDLNDALLIGEKYVLIDRFDLADLSRIYLYRRSAWPPRLITVNIHADPKSSDGQPHDFNAYMRDSIMQVILSRWSGNKSQVGP
jgi:hypothetical protein